jgi:hypothetical protein
MTSARPPELRLADEFFLAAHDHEASRMRPRLLPVVLSLGLSGALLAELIMESRIGQLDGYILAANRAALNSGRHRASRDGDSVTERIMHEITNQPGEPVSVWLGQVRHYATDGVLDRLFAAGLLREAKGRRWWGGATTEYQTVDPNLAMGPEARVFGLVSGARRNNSNLGAVILAGLTDATGLRAKMPVWDLSAAEVRSRMGQLRSGLPVPLRGLLADLETSVGAALLSSGHH